MVPIQVGDVFDVRDWSPPGPRTIVAVNPTTVVYRFHGSLTPHWQERSRSMIVIQTLIQSGRWWHRYPPEVRYPEGI